jgi:hypothetical protein
MPLGRLPVTFVEVLTAQFTIGRPVAQQVVDSRWREIRACNDNAALIMASATPRASL